MRSMFVGEQAGTLGAHLSRCMLACVLACTLGACANVPLRTRLTRSLVVTGAVVGVAGGAMTAGCVRDGVPGLCSAGPRDGTVRIGLPILAIGAALITTGLLIRPPPVRPQGPNTTRHATPTFGDPFGPPPLQGY